MHLLNQSPRERRGISLVELLVVVAIISIIMSMILVVLVKTYHAVEAFRH
ncbi:MAG TPA: prepilin-type N-terminal cleavage/methylation domain-containing protein [Tepidisphaeraceae bacterium]|jgi:prepilin-type N-terminal cleavage/methylation domain-containing protein|nr:prepilin-type N-terminal cleavage/methylation domain-containing protein [Tepidisphaeraceae bacterium]